MMHITLHPFHLLVPVGMPLFIFLCVYFWVVAENLIFNYHMGKKWKDQKLKYPDLNKCPECGFPQIYGRVQFEGWPFLILKKYYKEKFRCRKCGLDFDFLVKWNGVNGDPQ